VGVLPSAPSPLLGAPARPTRREARS